MGVVLPPGQTVLDAVQDWPSEYPNLIECADPDAVVDSCDFPATIPNDDVYDQHRLSWHLFPDNPVTAPDWWTPPVAPPIEPYSSDSSSVWPPPIAALGYGVYVGVIDTGVDYANPGLEATSSFHGINTGDKKKSTTAKLRTQGGGEPWDFLMERSQAYAAGLGHGTFVAGAVCAEADDDESTTLGPTDVLGVAPAAKYFPFAIKCKGVGNEEDGYHASWSMSALLNALSALGGVTGIYEEDLFEDPSTGN